jgi:hypothetical protein
MLDSSTFADVDASLQASDVSEATLVSAPGFLETVYADFAGPSRAGSRAATPMVVSIPDDFLEFDTAQHRQPLQILPQGPGPRSVRAVPSTPNSRGRCLDEPRTESRRAVTPPRQTDHGEERHYMALTTACKKKKTMTKTPLKGDYAPPPTPRRHLHRPSAAPQHPDVSAVNVSSDPDAEYAVVLSMYEVYNDKIYDLLTPPIRSNATKEYRRRPLLFKSTEQSTDRKVVAGLKKVVCTSLREAIMVLEAGLHERQVAGTGSNSVSSRSHGFFCVEVRKRQRGRRSAKWTGSTFTIVDLAGSERARDAKTQGSTLAEAGKINESLMYLGQCLQAQSGSGNASKVSCRHPARKSLLTCHSPASCPSDSAR